MERLTLDLLARVLADVPCGEEKEELRLVNKTWLKAIQFPEAHQRRILPAPSPAPQYDIYPESPLHSQFCCTSNRLRRLDPHVTLQDFEGCLQWLESSAVRSLRLSIGQYAWENDCPVLLEVEALEAFTSANKKDLLMLSKLFPNLKILYVHGLDDEGDHYWDPRSKKDFLIELSKLHKLLWLHISNCWVDCVLPKKCRLSLTVFEEYIGENFFNIAEHLEQICIKFAKIVDLRFLRSCFRLTQINVEFNDNDPNQLQGLENLPMSVSTIVVLENPLYWKYKEDLEFVPDEVHYVQCLSHGWQKQRFMNADAFGYILKRV